MVDDLDRGRQLVGIDPDDHMLPVVVHVLLPPVLEPMWTARRAFPLRAGQTLLEPRLVATPSRLELAGEPHRQLVGGRNGEQPAGHLDRVWPDTGPNGIV